MRLLSTCGPLGLLAVATVAAVPTLPRRDTTPAPDTLPVVRTAALHPMRYWVSVPAAWTPDKTWPVVLTFDGGNKDWVGNATDFAKERNARHYPFVVVTPEILTNGGSDLRHVDAYHYPDSVWTQVDKDGRCAFDWAGVNAVMAEVERLYHTEHKAFATGHSAGGHMAWLMVFRAPERLRAVVPTGGNFTGRCLTSEVPHPFPISTAPERVQLPVKLMEGALDPGLTNPQMANAMRLAAANGYRNVTRDTFPARQHERMPDLVLKYFATFLH